MPADTAEAAAAVIVAEAKVVAIIEDELNAATTALQANAPSVAAMTATKVVPAVAVVDAVAVVVGKAMVVIPIPPTTLLKN